MLFGAGRSRITRPGALNRATQSMWPSVMSWPARPGSQITFSMPSEALSRCSTSSWLSPGLRLGLTRELTVASSVPCPSVSSEPPSPTNGAWTRAIPYWASSAAAALASLAKFCS